MRLVQFLKCLVAILTLYLCVAAIHCDRPCRCCIHCSRELFNVIQKLQTKCSFHQFYYAISISQVSENFRLHAPNFCHLL